MIKQNGVNKNLFRRCVAFVININNQALNRLALQIVDYIIALHTMVRNVKNVSLVCWPLHEKLPSEAYFAMSFRSRSISGWNELLPKIFTSNDTGSNPGESTNTSNSPGGKMMTYRSEFGLGV